MRCESPFLVRNKDSSISHLFGKDKVLPVPCGKCKPCRDALVMQWAFRLEQESRRHVNVHFVTLTYDAEYVPITKNGLRSVCPKHLTDYIKRLRSRNEGKLKYFAVSEYGSKTHRPHYHLITFGVNHPVYFQKAWPYGFVHVGNDISEGALPYVLKYVHKDQVDKSEIWDDRVPEFRRMSQKLGSNYLTPEVVRWHLEDFENRRYVVNKQGFKLGMPRYYVDKLFEISGSNRYAFRQNRQRELDKVDKVDDIFTESAKRQRVKNYQLDKQKQSSKL